MAPSQPNWAWISVASDSSGMYLAAAQGGVDYDDYSGGIYTSTSGGSMWALTSAPTSRWVSIKSDSTGQYLAAVQGYNSESGSGIYVSTNYGSEWSLTSAPLATTNNQWRWSSVAIDGTGQYLAATQENGRVYTSTNGK